MNFKKIGIVTLTICAVVFVGGYLYFRTQGWGVLNIPFLVIPVGVILLFVGLSFFLLGKGVSKVQNSEENKILK